MDPFVHSLLECFLVFGFAVRIKPLTAEGEVVEFVKLLGEFLLGVVAPLPVIGRVAGCCHFALMQAITAFLALLPLA
jgi:hypothetical protein